MPPIKVGVAMSGGVDSTMAASLLLEQGYAVHGFFMLLPLPALEMQRQRVREVADRLSVPLTEIDLRRPFFDEIIRYFIASYQIGQTPNPCIHCNAAIKFGLLADAMLKAGMDRIATGHYARINPVGGHFALCRGVDRLKDQSYFLARLTSAQLRHTLFPLGDWTKEQVYGRALRQGFRFTGEESQDVCFLGAGLPAFLRGQGLKDAPGPVVTASGRRIGEHRGVWHYTIGQRRGLGLPDATPWYVVELDGRENRVVVGKNEDLLKAGCPVHSLVWTHTPPALPWQGRVQLRSRHAPAAARIDSSGPDCWQISFDSPQRAITPGQFAVFYEEDRVVGSAVVGPPKPAAGELCP